MLSIFMLYSNKDEDERTDARLLAQAAVSPAPDVLGRRNTSKIVDVDQELTKGSSETGGGTATERRSRSPTKRGLMKEPGFVQSLRAQGFEESVSKGKLTYDFKNTSPSSSSGYRSTSPTKMTAAERPNSPYKPNPHQFICPQKDSPATPGSYASSSTSKTPASSKSYRSVSPTRKLDPTKGSPFTPHPLQFVSPQRANSPAIPKAPPPPPSSLATVDGPPKPQRSYASSTATENENTAMKLWKTEKSLTVTPVPPSPPKNNSPNKRSYLDMHNTAEGSIFPTTAITSDIRLRKNNDEAENATTDTASRRSIFEKRNMFETSGSPPPKDSPDPAMLPISQRKALFEKNRSGAVPKPVGRFGESVTPAMLRAAQSASSNAPASEPNWKRRREISPQRRLLQNTPAAAPVHHVSPSKMEEDESSKMLGIQKRFEKSRRLFENVNDEWKENDITKTSDEARKKDMEMLMNRFNRQRNDNMDNNEALTTSTKEVDIEMKTGSTADGNSSTIVSERTARQSPRKDNSGSYPGVDSLKRIKVSPPKPGQLYPDLNDIYGSTSDTASEVERPGTAMSDDSCAPSEAPSLGTAIKHAASTHR